MDEIARRHLPGGIAPRVEWIGLAEHWLRRQVYYLHDNENPRLGRPLDDWRTLLPEILRRRERGDRSQVGDDCDAWSFTAIDIAREAGVPMKDCRLLMVLSPLGQRTAADLDHMIGAVRLHGRWWVVGDTFRVGPYPAEECPHELFAQHRLPLRGNDWRKVREWAEA